MTKSKTIKIDPKKIVFASDTYHVICWCYECDWELFPTAWLDPENLEQEQEMLVDLYQDAHDHICKATINCKFTKVEPETTY